MYEGAIKYRQKLLRKWAKSGKPAGWTDAYFELNKKLVQEQIDSFVNSLEYQTDRELEQQMEVE